MGIAFFFVNMLIRNWTTFAVLYLGIPTFFFVWLHFYTNTEMAITMKHDLRLSTFLIHAKTRLSNFQFSFQRGKRGRRCFFSSQLYHIWRIISHWWRNPSKVSEGFTEGEFHGEKFWFLFVYLSNVTESAKFPVERRTWFYVVNSCFFIITVHLLKIKLVFLLKIAGSQHASLTRQSRRNSGSKYVDAWNSWINC